MVFHLKTINFVKTVVEIAQLTNEEVIQEIVWFKWKDNIQLEKYTLYTV